MQEKLSDEDWKKLIAFELKNSDRATISMWRCGFFGRMPPSHSITAFGIDSIDHVLAIQWCILNHKITPKMLNDVSKDGKKITELISKNSKSKIVFQTIWDI